MKLKPYDSYTPIDGKWLSSIPESWTNTKIKFETKFTTGWTPSSGDDSLYDGDYLWANISDIGDRYLSDTKKRIGDDALKLSNIPLSKAGSLLFSFKLSVGHVSICTTDMYTNEAIATFPAGSDIHISYGYYAYPIFIVKNASENIYGAKLLNQDLIKNAFIALPKFNDQVKISNFLDLQTKKLDTLISKQEKLIELLQEKRQAIISHAVTKGLDPDVHMKNSGVEWIGDTPENWKIVQFRHMVSILNGSDYKHVETDDGDYPVIGSGGEFKRASEWLYDGPSVLLGRKGTIDRPLFINGKFWVVDTMFYTKIKENINPKYAYYCSKIIPFDFFSSSTALPSMTQDDLKSIKFSIPKNYDEQEKVVEFIEDKLSTIDSLILKSLDSINLVKEHRTALISAAVTGKIDVRDYNLEEAF